MCSVTANPGQGLGPAFLAEGTLQHSVMLTTVVLIMSCISTPPRQNLLSDQYSGDLDVEPSATPSSGVGMDSHRAPPSPAVKLPKPFP